MAKPKGLAAKYTVLRSPIVHDGETYQPGEPIELVFADAEPLIAVSANEAVPEKQAAKEPPKT